MGGTSTSIGGCDIDVADCLCGGVVDAEDCLRCLRGGVVDVEDCLRMFVKSMGASLSIVGVTGRLDWVRPRGGGVDVEDCLRMFVKSMGASLSIVGVTGRLDWVLDWLRWKSWLCCVLCCEVNITSSSYSSPSSSFSSSKEGAFSKKGTFSKEGLLERSEIRLLLLKPLAPRVPPVPARLPLPLEPLARPAPLSSEIKGFKIDIQRVLMFINIIV
jgi:hypothetical protein